jgi:hypothetical protein
LSLLLITHSPAPKVSVFLSLHASKQIADNVRLGRQLDLASSVDSNTDSLVVGQARVLEAVCV